MSSTGSRFRPFRQSRQLRSIIAAAGLLLSLPAAAASLQIGAAAGAMLPLTGVNVGPVAAGDGGNPAVGPAYRTRGVRLVRTHDFYGPLDMATLYPDRSKSPDLASSFNFTGAVGSSGFSSDSVFTAIVDGGFEPYFRIGDSYNNVTVPGTTERANWVQAAVNVLRHYREGQWSGFQNEFRYAEIWNEPDNLIFWPRGNSRADFFNLYIDTAKALRSAFPALKIGGPGLTPMGCKTESGQRWTSDFLDAVKAAGAPLDFFSWHLYTNDPADFTSCARFFRTTLDTKGFTSAESHLTEWNTDAESVTAGEQVALRTGGRGAAILTAGWNAMQQEGVTQSLFYRGTDPSMNLPTFYGMFYANGQPKKIADAAILWRLMSGYSRQHTVSGTTATLSALAGRSDDGAYALLLANTGSTVENWTAALTGASLSGYRMSTLTVSDSAPGVVAGSTQTIAGEAVQLVLLTPQTQTFSATATVSGSSTAQTMTAVLTPAAEDVGASHMVFLAALVGDTLYCRDDIRWTSCGASTAAYNGPLPARLELPVLNKGDVRDLAGITVFIGYGSTLNDVITRQRYQQIHRF